MSHQVYSEPGKAALALVIVEGEGKNVMLYGHLDKQPHMEGWEEGLGPITPVVRGDRLYGRGSSDDGYMPFASLLAIKNCQKQGVKLPRVVLVLETEEESASPSLVYLLGKVEDSLQTPDLCICMDSGALTYDQLWLTSSLRGCLVVDLKVESIEGGQHSGIAGGIAPETFSVARALIDRLDNSSTQEVIPELQVEIP